MTTRGDGLVIRLRQSLSLLICGLVLVCAFIGLLDPSSVRADVGVQPVLPVGSSIKPGEETPIQMAAEVVTMNVRAATEADNVLVKLNPKSYGYNVLPVWFPAIAEVEADFTMKNPTSEVLSMNVWFPLASALENTDWNFNPGEIVPTIESFQVSVDSNPLDYSVSELPNPKGPDKPPLPWASFPVTFPPGKETVIHVSYALPLKPFPKQPAMILNYIFQTGAGWAGPIGQAKLILNLPFPATAETLAGKGKANLRPVYLPAPAGLPPGVVLNGNQARWTWENLEPGPEDDFQVWLLQPDRWQELETARALVNAMPQDGLAWLDLASQYYSLSLTSYGRLLPLTFSPSYIPRSIAAYHMAAELLPEHPAPHVSLALLTLAPYMEDKNAPPEVIQYIQNEHKIAKELADKNPSLAIEGVMMYMLEDALYAYFSNDATATVDAATQAADRAIWNATQTAEATRNYATITVWAIDKSTSMARRATEMACWTTAGADCTATAPPTVTPALKPTLTTSPTRTSTSTPVSTPHPTRSTPIPLAQQGQGASQGQYLAVIVAAGVIGMAFIVYLVMSRMRNLGKQ